MRPITAKALFKNIWMAAPAGVSITSVVTDNRNATPGCVFVAIKGERVDGHNYAVKAMEAGAVCVVAQRLMEGIPEDRTVLVPDVLDAMITMGANYRSAYSPLVLGVTGSVGKTTTKEFGAAIFSAFGNTVKTLGNQNNEIGMPQTLFRLDETTRYAVVEMGMQRLGEISKLTRAARPDAGIITKIGQSHIETVGNVEGVRKAKLEICEGMPYGAPLVLNGDDAMLRGAAIPGNVRPFFAGIENEQNDVRAVDIHREGQGQAFLIRDVQYGEFSACIPALGNHYIGDALLAYTAATRLGLGAQNCADALQNFEAAGGRQQITETGGVVFLEDYYNANPDSMRAALTTLAGLEVEGRRIAVLGDMLELGDAARAAHRTLGGEVAGAGVDLLITVGDLAALAAAEAHKQGIQAVTLRTNVEAARFLGKNARAGDAVLLKASRGMRFEEIAAQASLT